MAARLSAMGRREKAYFPSNVFVALCSKIYGMEVKNSDKKCVAFIKFRGKCSLISLGGGRLSAV